MDWTEQLSRPCPECGGRRERADVSGYMWLRPANARFSFSGNDKVHALVCATCGYTTFYTDTPGTFARDDDR